MYKKEILIEYFNLNIKWVFSSRLFFEKKNIHFTKFICTIYNKKKEKTVSISFGNLAIVDEENSCIIVELLSLKLDYLYLSI